MEPLVPCRVWARRVRCGGRIVWDGLVLRRSLPICVVLSGTTVPKPPKRPLFMACLAPVRPCPQRLRQPSSPALASPSSRGKKPGCRRPPLTLRPDGASRPSRRSWTAIEAAWAACENPRETKWHRLAVSPAARRRLHRQISTLTLSVKATIRPSTATTTRRPTTGSTLTASSSARPGPRRPARPVPNTSRSSSTTLPSPRPSTRPWSRATTASTSSSGRAEPTRGVSPRARRRVPSPWDYAEHGAENRGNARLRPPLRITPHSA